MQKVRIVGGKSTAGRVSILSDTFVATARSDEDGEVTCKVKRHSPLSRFLYKNKRLPIPRLVRMILFFVDSMTRKGRMLLGLYTLGVVLLDKFLSSGGSVFGPSVSAFLKQYRWIIYAVVLVGALVYIHRRIATWHGAEHMAIAAYDRTGATDVQAIVRECPVHDKCGGRLFLPLVVGMIIANLVAKNFGVSETIVSLAILECMLWLDTLMGWDKIPGTSQASHFLQRWVTTRYPGKQELRTAQLALQELVAAHHVS